MSELAQSADIEFKKRILHEMEKDNGVLYQKMVGLCLKNVSVTEEDKVEFGFELASIILGYKRRFSDPKYFQRIKDCMKNLAEVADRLGECEKALATLDSPHMLLMARFFPSLGLPDETTTFPWILREIKRAETLALATRAALNLAAGYNVVGGRGQPPLPYLFPTMDLIELWERWSGLPVVSAKGHKGDTTTDNATFIFSGLKMLKASVTTQNSITCINQALDLFKSPSHQAGIGKSKDELWALMQQFLADQK